jgi:hypothetical protein
MIEKVTDVKTVPTGGILLNFPAIDETLLTIKFFKNNLKYMHLKELSNGQIQDVPPVIGAHPLAVVNNESSLLSKLPMIGIEPITTIPEEIQIGVHPSDGFRVNQEWIDKLKNIPTDEKMFPDSLLENIQIIFDKRTTDGRNLYVHANSVIEEGGVQISLWSASYEQTRILRKVIKSLLIEFYRGIQKYGVKPSKYTLEPMLYSWSEAGDALYGSEFTLPFMTRNMNYIIDIELQEIKNVGVGVYGLVDSETFLFFRPFDVEEGVLFGREEVEYGIKDELINN